MFMQDYYLTRRGDRSELEQGRRGASLHFVKDNYPIRFKVIYFSVSFPCGLEGNKNIELTSTSFI